MTGIDQHTVSKEAKDIVTGTRGKRGYKRGYPVAILVGFDESRVVVWRVFSHVAKLFATVMLSGSRRDQRALYGFHEALVATLRPMLKEGVRSIILASPPRTSYAGEFLNHLQKHHAYMTQVNSPDHLAFGTLVASAIQPHEIAELAKTREFRTLIGQTTSVEADQILVTLEKRLNEPDRQTVTLFSLSEIEELICSRQESDAVRPEYVIVTDRYLAESSDKNRVQRLLQISQNRNVRTRVINAETSAGKRLSQLGGLVCFGRFVWKDGKH